MTNQYEVTWKIHLSWFLEKMLATREIALRIIRCAILPFALWWALQLAGRDSFFLLFCTVAICQSIYDTFCNLFQRIKDIKAQYRNKVIFYETENWIQKVVFQEDDIVLTEGNVTVRFTYSNIANIRDKGNKVWITFHDKTVIRLYKDAFIDSDWEACKSKLRTSCFYA